MKGPDFRRGLLDVLFPVTDIVVFSTLIAFVISDKGAFLGAGGVAYTMGPTGGDATDLG